MRARLRDRRPLAWGERSSAKNARAEPIVTYGAPHSFSGVLSTPTDTASAAAYGARLPGILTITNSTARLRVGQGVWVEASRRSDPDYTVIAEHRTPRTVSYIIERRGAYGG